MMKHVCTFLSVLLLALPAKAQDISLGLDWFINPDHAPIIIAQELGLFEERGLNVDIVAPSDPSEPPRLVAAGRMDLAVSYQPQLHLQREEGLPLIWAGTLIATPLNCLLVRADGLVQDLSDLKGRRIGYSVSGVEQALVTALLKEGGLTLEDVTMTNVNWSLSPSLMSGQVDAVIGAFRNFELTQMRLEGVEGRCFYLEEHGVPSYDELIFVVQESRAEAPWIDPFMDAIGDATRRIINDPDGMWNLYVAAHPELNDELNRNAWRDTLPRFALRPSAFDTRRYQEFANFLMENGLIDKAQNIDELRR